MLLLSRVPRCFVRFMCRLRLVPLLLCLSSQGPAAWAAESPTLSRLRDTGVLALGFRVASPPFSYLDAKRAPVGYSIDLCRHIVEAVKKRLDMPELEVKLVPVTSATRMPMVANGTVDLECGITTNTVERQRTQAFSLTTFVAESRLLSKRSAGIRGIDDLRGLPVSSTIATTSIQFLHQLNQTRHLDMKILAGLDDRDAFRMVQTDRAVAYAMDDVLLRVALASVANADEYVISEAAYSVEPYAIGLPRDDPQFKQLADGVLAELYRSGEIMAIYRRWFLAAIPPKGVNLQLPPSEAFKRIVQQPTDSPDPQHYR